jgi:hypothetical protein
LGKFICWETGFIRKIVRDSGTKVNRDAGKLFGTRERYSNLSAFSFSPLYFSSLVDVLRVTPGTAVDNTLGTAVDNTSWTAVDNTSDEYDSESSDDYDSDGIDKDDFEDSIKCNSTERLDRSDRRVIGQDNDKVWEANNHFLESGQFICVTI